MFLNFIEVLTMVMPPPSLFSSQCLSLADDGAFVPVNEGGAPILFTVFAVISEI